MSSTMQPKQQEHLVQTSPKPRTAGFKAWISVVLIPVLLVAAGFATSLTYQVLGFRPETGNAPLWVDALAGLVAMVLFLPPCVAAVIYGRAEGREGDWKGWLALAIGAAAGLGLTILTMVSTFGPF